MEGLGIRTPMIFSQGYILMSVFNRTYVSVISFIRGLNILGFIISKSVEHTLQVVFLSVLFEIHHKYSWTGGPICCPKSCKQIQTHLRMMFNVRERTVKGPQVSFFTRDIEMMTKLYLFWSVLACLYWTTHWSSTNYQ